MIKKIFTFAQHFSFNLIPAFTILLSVFLTIIPYKVSNVSLLMPLVVYIVIYFWTIYRPQMVPQILVLILGLFKDVVESNILGLSAVSFLLFQVIIQSQRKYILNNLFIVIWAEFVFCLSLILLFPLLLSKFSVSVNFYPLHIIFMQWLITIFVYVPIHWLLYKLNKLRS